MANLTKIESTTAIHDFPTIYNSNNDEILKEFDSFKSEWETFQKKYSTELATMLRRFNALHTQLIKEIDTKVNAETIQEKITGVYTTEQSDKLISALNAKIQALETRITTLENK